MTTNPNAPPPMLGKNLRRARLEREMTQAEVAQEIGAPSRQDVWRWEHAIVEPGTAYRQKLANLFFDGELAALYREVEEVSA